MSETFYETSFRFKWGVGFFIEFLQQSLEATPTQANIQYNLEQVGFYYDTIEKEFQENQETSSFSTKTNFVLQMPEALYEKLLLDFNTPHHILKDSLITEFSKEDIDKKDQQRIATLHDYYDELPVVESILSYTQLSLVKKAPHTWVIEDPNPQIQKENQALI